MAAGGWRLAAGGWRLVAADAGCLLLMLVMLVAGGWWLVAGGWWLVAGGWWQPPCVAAGGWSVLDAGAPQAPAAPAAPAAAATHDAAARPDPAPCVVPPLCRATANLSAVSSWSIERDSGRRFILNGMWESPAAGAGSYSTRSRAIFTAAASGNHTFFLVADDVGQLTGTYITVGGRACVMTSCVHRNTLIQMRTS